MIIFQRNNAKTIQNEFEKRKIYCIPITSSSQVREKRIIDIISALEREIVEIKILSISKFEITNTSDNLYICIPLFVLLPGDENVQDRFFINSDIIEPGEIKLVTIGLCGNIAARIYGNLLNEGMVFPLFTSLHRKFVKNKIQTQLNEVDLISINSDAYNKTLDYDDIRKIVETIEQIIIGIFGNSDSSKYFRIYDRINRKGNEEGYVEFDQHLHINCFLYFHFDKSIKSILKQINDLLSQYGLIELLRFNFLLHELDKTLKLILKSTISTNIKNKQELKKKIDILFSVRNNIFELCDKLQHMTEYYFEPQYELRIREYFRDSVSTRNNYQSLFWKWIERLSLHNFNDGGKGNFGVYEKLRTINDRGQYKINMLDSMQNEIGYLFISDSGHYNLQIINQPEGWKMYKQHLVRSLQGSLELITEIEENAKPVNLDKIIDKIQDKINTLDEDYIFDFGDFKKSKFLLT